MDSYNSIMIFFPSEIICCAFKFFWLSERINAIYFILYIFLADNGDLLLKLKHGRNILWICFVSFNNFSSSRF